QTEYFGHLEDYQVCVFDNRGIGKSEITGGNFSISMFAKDTVDLLDHLGWKKDIHIAGVSLGGMITQKVLLLDGDRFESATLISTYHSAVFAMPTIGDLRYFLQSFTSSRDQITEHLLKLCFSKKWLNSPYTEDSTHTNREMLMTAFNAFKHEPGESKLRQEADMKQMQATWWHNLNLWQMHKLGKTRARTLVMHGSKDKVIRMACGRTLSLLLNSPFVLMEGSGHMIMIDNHHKFNRHLRGHIENRFPD
ncbi:Alpha/Beta hydrolase protein, partial [Dimargaris cristalligena]